MIADKQSHTLLFLVGPPSSLAILFTGGSSNYSLVQSMRTLIITFPWHIDVM